LNRIKIIATNLIDLSTKCENYIYFISNPKFESLEFYSFLSTTERFTSL